MVCVVQFLEKHTKLMTLFTFLHFILYSQPCCNLFFTNNFYTLVHLPKLSLLSITDFCVVQVKDFLLALPTLEYTQLLEKKLKI